MSPFRVENGILVVKSVPFIRAECWQEAQTESLKRIESNEEKKKAMEKGGRNEREIVEYVRKGQGLLCGKSLKRVAV